MRSLSKVRVSVLFLALCAVSVAACGDDDGGGVGGGAGGGAGGGTGGGTGGGSGDGGLSAEEMCVSDATARGEVGDCPACMCSDASTCRDELQACYDATDMAEGGPAVGESKAALCEAVVVCGRTAGCTGTDCYLGDDGIGPNPGPCEAEIEAAAESTTLATIVARSTNTAYAIGRANAIGTCAEANCSTQCL